MSNSQKSIKESDRTNVQQCLIVHYIFHGLIKVSLNGKEAKDPLFLFVDCQNHLQRTTELQPEFVRQLFCQVPHCSYKHLKNKA